MFSAQVITEIFIIWSRQKQDTKISMVVSILSGNITTYSDNKKKG